MVDGITCNVSMVIDEDDKINVGLHYNDTQDRDIAVEVSGTDFVSVFDTLYEAFVEQLSDEPEQEEPNTELLLQENEQLRDEVCYLRELIETMNEDFDNVCNENDLLWEELESKQCSCPQTEEADLETAQGWMDFLDNLEVYLKRMGL